MHHHDEHDNLEGYADAAEYAHRDRSDTGVAFYLALAKEYGGPVLEIGCGTGRVLIPIARAGFAATGLDIVPGMLAQARIEADGIPIDWVEGDGRSFRLERRFRLVFLTGNAFQAFLTRADQERLLARVHEHLAPGGMLAFETRNPRWPDQAVHTGRGTSAVPAVDAADAGHTADAGEQASPAHTAHGTGGRAASAGGYRPIDAPGEGLFSYLETWETEQDCGSFMDHQGRTVRESLTQVYDHVSQILHWTGYRRWVDEKGQEQVAVTRTSVRFTFPQELEALLHYNGFRIERRYGDWGCEPLSATSPSIIVVCGAEHPRNA